MNVDLVYVRTEDGLRLDGIWRKPSADAPSQLGADVIILHHGVGGNFYGLGLFEEYTDALVDAGCAVLRVNNRGHHPVNRGPVDGSRYGAAYEIVEDCRYDWDAWLNFAQEAGYRRIALWGHSLGAVKSIYYMATEQDSRVKLVIASSPPRFSYSAYRGMDEWDAYKVQYDQAKKHVEAGHPEALMEVAHPSANLLTASVFLDKYGPEEKYDVVKLIPNVKVPLLVTIGSKEGVVRGAANSLMGFSGLAGEVEKLSGESDHLTFAPIPEGDHFYTGQSDHAWKLISGWMEKL